MVDDDDTVWAEIEQAYTATSAPLSELGGRFGIAWQAIMARARRERWKRKATAGKAPARKAAAATKTVNPRTLVKRVYATIDTELTKLEQQKGASSQDRERASRALSQMVTSLEKAVEMQREITKEQGRKPRPAVKRTDHRPTPHIA